MHTAINEPDTTIADRERRLHEASDAYYNDLPVMSDKEFDKLWKEHQQARIDDPDHAQWKNTILDEVGVRPRKASGFKKVQHATKMMSLDNLFVDDDGNVSQLDKWLQGICAELGEGTFVCAEPKIDGLSMSIVYENGILAQAVTRGDGFEGDDVTDNVRVAGFVPATIITDDYWNGAGTLNDPRGRIEFRGEVFLTFAAFEELNRKAEAAGEETYSNPRNAAAGLIRRKDSASLQGCGLQFVCHGFQDPKMPLYSDESARWSLRGINYPDGFLFQAASTPPNDMLRRLMQRPYPTDGVVFKLNNFSQRTKLGETSRAPRWAIALKFEQPQVETTCNAIAVQVGRSGVFTPVAELEPVEVDGSVVSRATLHNEDQINRLGLRVGDKVIIQKAGGIIPEIVMVVGKRTLPARFSLLEHINHKCPSCGCDKIITTGQAEGNSATKYSCGNPSCKAKMAARIEHMASRGCLNIDQLGGEAAEALAAGKGMGGAPKYHPFEILEKQAPWFARIEWTTESGGKMTIGDSRAKKIRAGIEAAQKLPLNRWLAACGIPSIGENTSKEISRLFKDARELLLLHPEAVFGLDTDARRIDAITHIAMGGDKADPKVADYKISHHLGPVSAQALIDFVKSPDGAYALEIMTGYNVKSDNWDPIPAEAEAGLLTGKSICVTGTLSVPREEIHELIRANGGTVVTSVSKKTNILVAGDKAGSKMKKAAELGVEVWTESELRGVIA